MKRRKVKQPRAAGLQRVCSKPAQRVIGRPFPKGVSGNPNGKRKSSVSPTAALKRALTREDAGRIAQKLIALAKAGDAVALKILLDRCDGPLNGPLAIATATAQASSDTTAQAVVIIVDNHREDHDYIQRASDEQLYALAGIQGKKWLAPSSALPAPAPPPPAAESTAESIEPEGELSPVVSGQEFLED